MNVDVYARQFGQFVAKPWLSPAGWVLGAAAGVAAVIGSSLKTGMGTLPDALVAALAMAALVTLWRGAAAARCG